MVEFVVEFTRLLSAVSWPKMTVGLEMMRTPERRRQPTLAL